MGFPESIRAALERGHERWPGIAISPAAFQTHVDRSELTESALANHGEDLFLAVACLAHQPQALKAFDKAYLVRVGIFISRVSKETDVVDEVTQQIRIRLFTGEDPKLAHYRGEGPLEGWVRVVALRTALNVLEARRYDRHAPASEQELGNALSPFLRADKAAEGAQLQPQVQAALTAALEALPARSKALLRLHFVEHLNIEEIGRMYQVHRATVARWLVTIRNDLFSKVQESMKLRLDVSPSEFRSLFDAVRSDLHASLSRILPQSPAAPVQVAKNP
jgi:RNA polymerase sigma-70 factor, ECF subfamily